VAGTFDWQQVTGNPVDILQVRPANAGWRGSGWALCVAEAPVCKFWMKEDHYE